MSSFIRPKSLYEVTERALAGAKLDYEFRDFLDAFYCQLDPEKKSAMLEREPIWLEQPDYADAHLAAAAEHLAREYRLLIPAWTEDPRRFLDRPHFPGGTQSLKAICIAESPIAFRRRLIFVDSSVLYRPRKDRPVAFLDDGYGEGAKGSEAGQRSDSD